MGVNPDGSVITQDGRSKVTSDPHGLNFPAGWLPQPFNDVNDAPVAEEYFSQAGREVAAMPLRFFTSPAGDVSDKIRSLTKVEGDRLIMLDIPSDGAFYVCEASSSDAAGVRSFISDVLAGKVERKQLGQ